MRTLIRSGLIVTDEVISPGDILIEDGRIVKISKFIDRQDPEAEGAEMIRAVGRIVMPGAVDIHTHMDLDVGIARACDDFYTGTVAAACGGTTTIVDHMAFGPKGCSPWHQVKEYHRLADGNAVVDYGFHGVLQHVDDEVLDDMAQIAKEEGITSFKAYMTYDGRLDDLDLMKVLERAAKEKILIAVHCENHGIVTCFRERFVREGKTQTRWHPVSRPAEAEAEAVNRLLYLAQAAGEAPVYVVHLSTKKGLEEIRKAKAAGRKHMGAETCPQYLSAGRPEGDYGTAAPPAGRPGRTVGCPEGERTGHGRDGSLPLYLCEAEAAGGGRFHQVSQRRAGRGGAAHAALFRRCEEGTDYPAATGEVRVYESGTGGRAVPAQRHDRGRRGRGPGDPEPGEGMDADGAEDAQRCGLYVL